MEDIVGLQGVLVAELFYRRDLPGKVPILLLVMGGNAAINSNLGLL